MSKTISVTLPDTLADWVAGRVGENGYGTASDYICALLRDDHRRAHPNQPLSLEELQQMLDDSRASGISDKSVDDIFEQVLAKAETRNARFG